jgi:hypothetical protein
MCAEDVSRYGLRRVLNTPWNGHRLAAPCSVVDATSVRVSRKMVNALWKNQWYLSEISPGILRYASLIKRYFSLCLTDKIT